MITKTGLSFEYGMVGENVSRLENKFEWGGGGAR